MGQTTEGLLLRAGLAPGLRCLDVGCGIGEVTITIARLVGPGGQAVGIDSDAHFLDLASREAADRGVAAVFRVGDANDLHPETGYDLVYARFVLSPLPDPAPVVGQLVGAARPGGMIVVEDVDFSGHFSDPGSDAFARYVELYRRVARLRGADPDLGPRLPGLLEEAGIEAAHVEVLLPTFREGDGKRMARATLEGIREAVIAAGLTTDPEVDAIVAGLGEFERDRRTIMSLPRIFQVWGRIGTSN